MRSRRRFEMALDRRGNAAPLLHDCASSVAAVIWTRDTIRALIQERRQPKRMRTRSTKLIAASLLVGGLAAATVALSRRDASPFDEAMAAYRADLSRFDRALDKLSKTLEHPDSAAAQRAFREARTAFKRVELFVEYYGQFAEREVNGPPLFRAEDEDPETPLAPAGLQVVEADLFPSLNTARLGGHLDARSG